MEKKVASYVQNTWSIWALTDNFFVYVQKRILFPFHLRKKRWFWAVRNKFCSICPLYGMTHCYIKSFSLLSDNFQFI